MISDNPFLVNPDTALGASPSITGLMRLSVSQYSCVLLSHLREGGILRQQLRRTYKGMSHLDSAKTLRRVRALIPGSHLTVARGTARSKQDTVVKEGIFLNLASVHFTC